MEIRAKLSDQFVFCVGLYLLFGDSYVYLFNQVVFLCFKGKEVIMGRDLHHVLLLQLQ